MIEQECMNSGKVLVIGHRGAMGLAPENTMASFQLGWELGSDILELDVHLSKDGEMVVMHDPDVSRTTDGVGHVKDMLLSEIQQLDAGVVFDPSFAGQHVPTLEEVLSWAKSRIPLLIEIKGDPHPASGIVEKVVAAVNNEHMTDDVAIISFHHPTVKHVKQIDDSIATGILYTGRLCDPVGAARAAHADSVRPAWPYWTREEVDEVHAAGLVAHAWNAHEPELIEYVLSLGVDSIGSNYPDRLRKYLDKNGYSWTREQE